ncbi:MAG: hypothetical protein IJJ90_08720 [Prevotella sp.]|nr:hypothetical protein [Prevotella sp.]
MGLFYVRKPRSFNHPSIFSSGEEMEGRSAKSRGSGMVPASNRRMNDRPSIVSHLVAAVWVVLAVLLLFLAYQAVTGYYTL